MPLSATENSKQCPTPSHIHINPHIEGLFSWVSISQYNTSGFQKDMTKAKGGKTVHKDKSSELDSNMTKLLVLSEKYKIIMVNMLKTNGKCRQHVRIYR